MYWTMSIFFPLLERLLLNLDILSLFPDIRKKLDSLPSPLSSNRRRFLGSGSELRFLFTVHSRVSLRCCILCAYFMKILRRIQDEVRDEDITGVLVPVQTCFGWVIFDTFRRLV